MRQPVARARVARRGASAGPACRTPCLERPASPRPAPARVALRAAAGHASAAWLSGYTSAVYTRRFALSSWLLLLVACGDGAEADIDGGPDARPPTPLEQLVEDYEGGVISRDEFRFEIGRHEDAGHPTELPTEITTTILLKARPAPYELTATVTVAADAILVIEQGAALRFAPEVDLDVQGRIYAIGSEQATIHFFADAPDHFGGVKLHGGPNQLVWVEIDRGWRSVDVLHPLDTHSLIESARFDAWQDLAVHHSEAGPLRIVASRFGYQTDEADVSGETIRSWYSQTIHIEDNDFGYRRGYRDVLDLQECIEGAWPVVMGNRFDGGEDDAVDLDGCSALVIGNHIRNFRPEDLSVMVSGVNGGGVTGDRANSRPIIMNNVIDGCFHGIGFKNGARPVIINNTIINSNIGVTLYQAAVGEPMPDGLMLNNVLHNNVGWLNDEPQDILLNGKWWPGYNQVDDVQATIDARYNITATSPAPYEGEGNSNDDPLLELTDGIPRLGAGSPAIDSGLGSIELTDAPADVLDYLLTDFLGNPRALETLDRGAVEAQ